MTSDERRTTAAVEDLALAAVHAASSAGEVVLRPKALSEAQAEEAWRAADSLLKTAQKVMGALTTAAQGQATLCYHCHAFHAGHVAVCLNRDCQSMTLFHGCICGEVFHYVDPLDDKRKTEPMDGRSVHLTEYAREA